ncbi:MAG: aminoglycoside phosphotransferase family protein [Anaerolineales bacterium]|nr:aminoglycoside phosphotransferase family protein [Anaerolineales bacterium]
MWPFTKAQLTAGLRRYFGDSSLQVTAIHEQPLPHPANSLAPSDVRGARVEYVAGSMLGGRYRGRTMTIDCLVKEPGGKLRVGLAGNGLREVGVYRSLASQLPVQMPALIAADNAGSWLVLESVLPELDPAAWSAADYERAIRTLASIHERFWGLSDDLAVYPWLARPLATDFEVYVLSAVGAMEKMVVDNRPALITGSLEVLTGLGQMLTQAELLAERLRAVPATLLHGDFQPSNIYLQEDETIVFNWQLAGVGPGVLDLVTFVNACCWKQAEAQAKPPLPPEALLELYRAEIRTRVGVAWSDDEWAELLDHALMWRFIQDMLSWVANLPPDDFPHYEARFRDIWLRPVLDAANRRLRPVLYL